MTVEKGAQRGGLRLSGLRKSYGENVAVDGVTLDIPDGSLGALLGPSGCGKTTTLRMVAGLERPDGGHIALGEKTLCDDDGRYISPERRRIGMVFQSYAVWPHMTVAENIAFPLQAHGVPKSDIERRVGEAVQLVRLGSLAARYPGQLSGGQQQRVALARAVVIEPRLLLLDEPLSNLDASLREEMRFEIRTLQQRLAMTALFVTHDQDEALSLSDIVAVMDRGRVIQAGDPRDIYDRPATPFVARFVGWRNFLRGRVLDQSSISIDDHVVTAPSRMSSGTVVDACIRPEELSVRIAPPGSQRAAHEVPATVVAQLYKATHYELELDAGGKSLNARVPANASYSPGGQVFVGLTPGRVLLFPTNDAPRL